MNRSLRRSLVAVAVVAALGLGGAPAFAGTAGPDGQQAVEVDAQVRAELEAVFAHHGVEPGVWDSLVAKVRRGELLLADDPSAEPVSSGSDFVDGEQVIRNVYADGSVSLASMPEEFTPVPNPMLRDTTINTCGSIKTSASWKVYTNCRVVYDGISFSYSFYVDFETRSGYNAKITKAINPTVHRAIGNGISDVRAGIPRSTQSGTTAAQARMSFTMSTAYVSAWSRTVNLDFFVKGTSYSASTNL
ncbi:hypothetical protein [Cellulomonas sp. RIT-PI-Y]|uniref:hypothetical protein n=1 Tax=Cellulomonas sp. RIT-PI-Y TaxID=3035297 RepID=UPI0021D85AE0|nr:hypothetical protein [Cellulomonas sp. RIT-PI-Y]